MLASHRKLTAAAAVACSFLVPAAGARTNQGGAIPPDADACADDGNVAVIANRGLITTKEVAKPLDLPVRSSLVFDPELDGYRVAAAAAAGFVAPTAPRQSGDLDGIRVVDMEVPATATASAPKCVAVVQYPSGPRS